MFLVPTDDVLEIKGYVIRFDVNEILQVHVAPLKALGSTPVPPGSPPFAALAPRSLSPLSQPGPDPCRLRPGSPDLW